MKSNTSHSQLNITRRVESLEQLNEIRYFLTRTSLAELMNEQIQNEKFLEAEKTKKKIDALSSRELEFQKEANRSLEERELQILEESHAKELAEFNRNWDQRMKEYKKSVKIQEEDLFHRQAESFTSEKERLEQTIPVLTKYSSEYLNLKKMLEININNQNFQEAHLIKKRLHKIEEKQQESFQEARNIKIEKQILQFEVRQKLEMDNFRKKTTSGLNSLKRQKASELETLIKKFKKTREQVGSQERLMNSRLDASRLPMKDKTAMAAEVCEQSVFPDESCLEES